MFKVKKNPFMILLALLVALLPLLIVSFLVFGHSNPVIYVPLAITLLPSIFFSSALVRSHLVVTEHELKILFGWLTYRIPFDQIRYIRYTKNALSAPAWTFRRIEIGFDRFDQIFFSLPKEEELFFQTLKTHCPQADIQGVEI